MDYDKTFDPVLDSVVVVSDPHGPLAFRLIGALPQSVGGDAVIVTTASVLEFTSEEARGVDIVEGRLDMLHHAPLRAQPQFIPNGKTTKMSRKVKVKKTTSRPNGYPGAKLARKAAAGKLGKR